MPMLNVSHAQQVAYLRACRCRCTRALFLVVGPPIWPLSPVSDAQLRARTDIGRESMFPCVVTTSTHGARLIHVGRVLYLL